MLVARPLVRIRRDGEEAKIEITAKLTMPIARTTSIRESLVTCLGDRDDSFRTAFPVSGSIVSSERKAWFCEPAW
jgi:hypothetical protein